MLHLCTYWGGPLDGLTEAHENIPPGETLVSEDQNHIHPDEFYKDIFQDPRRTLKYHQYLLVEHEPKKKNIKQYVYKFNGLI